MPLEVHPDHLRRAVRALLHDGSVRVQGYEVTPLRESLGLATGALHRLSGSASTASGERNWSAVLKVVRPPSGTRHDAFARDPGHFAYWKREPLAYASGALADLPGALRAPRLLHLEEPAPEEVWLWLEHVPDAIGETWPRERFELAARHLGAFNGAYLAGRPLPQAQWLGRDYFRQRLLAAERAGGWPLFEDAAIWSNVREHFPTGAEALLRRIWHEHTRLLDRLDALPQTLRHGDAHRHNFIAAHEAGGTDVTVALDWGAMGIGAAGMDLLDLALGAAPELATGAEEARALVATLWRAYALGLSDADCEQIEDARRGFATGIALAGASRLHWALSRAVTHGQPSPASLRPLSVTAHAFLPLAEEALG